MKHLKQKFSFDRCSVETCRDILFPWNSKRGSDGKYYCWSCGTIK